MSSVALFLVAVASIFLLGAIGEAVFKRTNVPDVVWLIAAGIVLGPLTGLVTRAQLTVVAPYFAALTLVVVLFEGGSRLDLAQLTTAAPRSGLLALLTFFVAVGVVALVSMGAGAVGWLPGWSWMHGLLLGSILGGSSSIIIMPAMAQAKVEPRVGNLVNLESAFTDAFCVVGASAMIDVMLQRAAAAKAAALAAAANAAHAAESATAAAATAVEKVAPGAANAAVQAAASGESPWLALGRSFGIGLLIGGVAGFLWLIVLKPIRQSEHAYPITLSALLLLYVAIDRLGGSAALGILAFAVIVGNATTIGKKVGFISEVELRSDVRGFHSQMAFIIKSFFFTFIGAMLAPPWSLILLGVMLGGLLLIARVPGAWVSTLGGKFTPAQKRLVVVAMPRGMAAGVLATLPAAAGVPSTEQLPTVVFACVLTSILLFAVGFPLVRRTGKGAALPAQAALAGAEVPAAAAPTAADGGAASASAVAAAAAGTAAPAAEPEKAPEPSAPKPATGT